MFNKEILKLYFICGTTTCNNKNLEQVVEEALRGGITSFQFREKGDGALVGFQKEELARKIQNLCRLYQVPFIINDDIELAVKLDADGVHVGQGDGDVEKIRKLLPDKIIGLSVGNEEEQRRSKLEFVDYIGVGPVHSTISKNDAGGAIGYKGLKKMRKLAPEIPIVAIGGITKEDIKNIVATGVEGVSIISAISYSENIKQTVEQMINEYKNYVE